MNETENIETIKEAFDFLYLNGRHLTSGQSDFIQSLKKQFKRNKTLSAKQQSTLFEIKKYLNVDEQSVRFTARILG